MIQIRFEEREKIGLQYILESLHGCSPFGQERIRRLRYYTPDERQELEQELRNVERAAAHAEELKDLYDQICVVLCQMKDIRGSLRRCRELEVPDHVELFELKGYLQRLETLRPLFEKLRDTAGLTGLAFHDPAAALAILDPENTRSRGFYIPDAATPRLREIRSAKKQVEEQLYRAQTDAEKDDLRQKRVRICAEEDSEEMKVRRSMGAALAPMADDLLADADTAGRLDFLIQKALFAYRFGGVRPELTDTALELTDMINPELCDLLQEQGRAFVPVSISLTPGATVITGANMAGKSTYLRTVGINYLLACIGAPVCARQMEICPARLITSLRTSDSLNDNESYFFAELKRLKLIIDKLQAGEELFIILDEILKGTNSMDKQKGSFSLIKQFMTLQANGIIATHDLLLGTLIDLFPDDIRNYRFEADITDNELTFSYRLRPGIAQNMNACFLMKKMGIAVAD